MIVTNGASVTPKIYNHDIMHCTHEAVMGNHLYCGRVLGLTEPDDIIQLHPDLQSQWQAIAEHYSRIGLSHSENVIWDVSLDILSKQPDREISVFIFGDAVHQASQDDDWFRRVNENWLNVVEYINSKNNFIALAHKLGVSVPQTWCFDNRAALTNPAQFSYPCYLKAAISVDGIGIYRCEDEQQLQQALQTFADSTPLQVQAEVKAPSFLNLQYQVTADGVKRLAATEQVLDGFTHSGNRYPTVHQPWEIVEPMAEWMTQQGMKSIFAFDVAVVETATDTSYLAIECNPRFNGASYPTGIANKLKIASWISKTLTTKHRSLSALDLSGIEYDAQSGTGVILVNWGSILVGKVSVLLAGSREKQQELEAQLLKRLD
ncbi:MAG: ATP-grasp domain-containing protein [Cyanophyceae cyanobacterium]